MKMRCFLWVCHDEGTGSRSCLLTSSSMHPGIISPQGASNAICHSWSEQRRHDSGVWRGFGAVCGALPVGTLRSAELSLCYSRVLNAKCN